MMDTNILATEIATRRTRILNELAGLSHPPAQLIAVTKGQPAPVIDAILATGQRTFGENRVQEAYQRWAARRDDYPDLALHLIGPLQTNKAEAAVGLFDVIQTLDRERLADSLVAAVQRVGRRPDFMIQVNTGEEPQKSGVIPSGLESLLIYVREQCGLPVSGLMCIPPANEPAAPHFVLLAKLAQAYQLNCLSMGMSGDYQLAARCGATHVRVGSALLGDRS
jgi:hypothetical protein